LTMISLIKRHTHAIACLATVSQALS